MVDIVQKQGLDPDINITSPSISWDFEYVANDSLRLRSGYGNASNEIDFSRASTTGSINKSDVVETLAVDEPSIVKGGLEVYGETINEILWSEDFSNAAWEANNCTVSQDGALAPDGVGQAWKVTPPPSGSSILRQSIASSKESVIVSFWVKGVKGETLKIEARAGDSSVVSQKQYTLSGEWERFSSEDMDWSGQTSSSVACSVRIDPPNTAREFYVWGASATKTQKPFPYIKTESTPVTRSPDTCSVPMMGNMPPAGKPFTIEVDGSLTITDKGERIVSTNGLYIGTQKMTGDSYSDRLVAYIYDVVSGHSCYLAAPVGVNYEKSRFTVTYDSNFIAKLYIDGKLIRSNQLTSSLTYSPSNLMYLGSTPTSNRLINNPIKALRIAHKALTADQIAARGGYQYE